MSVSHIHADDGGRCDAVPSSSTGRSLTASRASAAAILAFLAGLSALVLVRNPLEHTVFPPCPLHAATGLWCPGCGATRASYLLMKGDVGGALHFNAMWVLLAPFAAYQAIAFAGEAFGVRWLRRIPLTRSIGAGLVALMVAFFIVRNLPFGPFEVLNPLSSS